MTQLHLVVPGLLGPFSDALPDYVQQQLNQSEFNLLNKVFSRARLSALSATNYFDTLTHLIHPQCELSLCQLTADIDGIDIAEGFFYRADPVHFKAESDHALLMGADLLLPTYEEAAQLVDSFNQHFAEDDLSLHFTAQHRWYLKSSRPLALTFTALDYALGRDIKHFMPEDSASAKDALWWRKILNEAQMLFFQHAVNLQREASGELSINGLWLWDISANSNSVESLPVNQLFSDDVVANALAVQSGVANLPVSDFENISAPAVLVIDSLYKSVCYADIDAWVETLEVFCITELPAIIQLLMTKKIDEICFYPCDGQSFKINRMDLLKFWKNKRLISECILVD